MNAGVNTHEIPYFEYKAINSLVHSHVEELGTGLRAIIVFGALKTVGETYDIELLEVVDDWQGLPKYQAGSTSDFPMRGKLYMDFLPSGDFDKVGLGPESQQTQELIDKVLRGYEIVYEVPTGYARHILRRAQESRESLAGGERLADPRRLLTKTTGAR